MSVVSQQDQQKTKWKSCILCIINFPLSVYDDHVIMDRSERKDEELTIVNNFIILWYHDYKDLTFLVLC